MHIQYTATVLSDGGRESETDTHNTILGLGIQMAAKCQAQVQLWTSWIFEPNQPLNPLNHWTIEPIEPLNQFTLNNWTSLELFEPLINETLELIEPLNK